MYNIITQWGENRKEVSFSKLRFAMAWAHSIAALKVADSIRVFDENGHIIAQAYLSEGGELRP